MCELPLRERRHVFERIRGKIAVDDLLRNVIVRDLRLVEFDDVEYVGLHALQREGLVANFHGLARLAFSEEHDLALGLLKELVHDPGHGLIVVPEFVELVGGHMTECLGHL
jgi:hypothetical protein